MRTNTRADGSFESAVATSVESFNGNHDGTMDRYHLPSRASRLDNVEHFPSLRVQYVPGDSPSAANLFADRSIDILFIDACHETYAVLRDVNGWIPTLAPGVNVAGDDHGWPSGPQAVSLRFADAPVTPSGCVWWTELPR